MNGKGCWGFVMSLKKSGLACLWGLSRPKHAGEHGWWQSVLDKTSADFRLVTKEIQESKPYI